MDDLQHIQRSISFDEEEKRDSALMVRWALTDWDQVKSRWLLRQYLLPGDHRLTFPRDVLQYHLLQKASSCQKPFHSAMAN